MALAAVRRRAPREPNLDAQAGAPVSGGHPLGGFPTGTGCVQVSGQPGLGARRGGLELLLRPDLIEGFGLRQSLSGGHGGLRTPAPELV